jgi:hypothetical protein
MPMNGLIRSRKPAGLALGRLSLIVAAACACLVLYARDPADGAPYPACPFRALTGRDCPFCGIGRALHALMHGNVVRAVGLYPLIVAMPLVLFGWLYAKRPTARIVWFAVGGLTLFAIVRNLPFGPVSWMASYR